MEDRHANGPQLVLRPHAGITPEQARDARARAWAFVLGCWQEKQIVAEPTQPGDTNDTPPVRNAEGVIHVANGPIDDQD